MGLKRLELNHGSINNVHSTRPGIQLEVSHANNCGALVNGWGAAISPTVASRLPKNATIRLTCRAVRSCRAVVGVELPDGSSGKRALYRRSCKREEVRKFTDFTTMQRTRTPVDPQFGRGHGFWGYERVVGDYRSVP